MEKKKDKEIPTYHKTGFKNVYVFEFFLFVCVTPPDGREAL